MKSVESSAMSSGLVSGQALAAGGISTAKEPAASALPLTSGPGWFRVWILFVAITSQVAKNPLSAKSHFFRDIWIHRAGRIEG